MLSITAAQTILLSITALWSSTGCQNGALEKAFEHALKGIS